MADANLEHRVEILEEKMGELQDVPARLAAVESQIVQIRSEMRSEFSAVRAEMRTMIDETRLEMRVLHEEVISRIALLQEGRASTRPPQTARRTRKKN